MLAAAGVDESALQCGCHAPGFFAATESSAASSVKWSPLFHNCSGKHAGFLAYARMHGQPSKPTSTPATPLQQRIRTIVARFARWATRLRRASDGCSAAE